MASLGKDKFIINVKILTPIYVNALFCVLSIESQYKTLRKCHTTL